MSGRHLQKLAGFHAHNLSSSRMSSTILFSRQRQGGTCTSLITDTSKGVMLNTESENFHPQKWSCLNMCNQCWSDPSYRVTSQEASSFYLHEQISVTASEETAIPVRTKTGGLSKSHRASEQGSGARPPASPLPSSLGTTTHTVCTVLQNKEALWK